MLTRLNLTFEGTPFNASQRCAVRSMYRYARSYSDIHRARANVLAAVRIALS